MEEVTQFKLRSESAKVDTEKGRGKKKKEEEISAKVRDNSSPITN